MTNIENEFDPEGEDVFYCQVETYRAAKDYLKGGLCVRLIAVKPNDFSYDRLSTGVTTFVIDIDFWHFCALESGLNWMFVNQSVRKQMERRDADIGINPRWLCLEVKYVANAKNYLYPTFSGLAPRFFDVVHLGPFSTKLVIPPVPLASFAGAITHNPTESWPFDASAASGKTFVFDTFHVGQGMCSLVHNESHGILLDLGAGKPVTRDLYLRKKIKNDLIAAVKNLKSLLLVISHADSDHWRIMGWDPNILAKIDKIYAPVGSISLAMKDKAIKNIYGLDNSTWHLDATTILQLWKSQPSYNDENGKCLVAVFKRGGRQVLVPGDYVYDRFSSDKNTGIQNLHNSAYDAVVVPHHGDQASGRNVVSAANNAQAFFSAGTHQSWRHPTNASLTAHISANYLNICNNTTPDITKVNLI